ncbi:MAG: hypothetical protein AAF721_13120 [Myxococcota bacterium]
MHRSLNRCPRGVCIAGLGAVVVALAACKTPEDDVDFAEGTAASAAMTTGTASTSTTGGPSDGGSTAALDGTGTTMGTKLDVAFETEGAETMGQQGCERIDFLFVIDNSGSMRDNQERLVSAFPGFIAAIQEEVAGTDHQIMVIDSDESPAWLCEEFLDGGHCDGTNVQPNDCNGYVCGSIDALDGCASTLGAGVVHPVGGFASNMDCGFPPDRRFLTSEDADLSTKFACAATVGISGNGDERPMTAMLAALDDPLGADGACNEGFLRDDAILVVTVVSDDPASMFSPDDDASAGDPTAWFDGVVAAKDGNLEAIAAIGLVPVDDTSCVFEDVPTDRFVEFFDAFGDRGVLASVCSSDYATVFAEAIGVIDTTCDEFQPEG